MSANSNLHAAKAAKNDEFYTRYEDINAEINTMEHGYRPHFKDAVVYCNCDDPEWSNFWKFFKDRFHAFGLKKLISTHYEKDGSASYMLEFDGTKTTKTELEGNGDFRSEECIELLKQADIVVTNPPFSMFREYVAQLTEYGKKFVILGNKNIITYKEIFPLLKGDEMWVGAKPMGGSLWFRTPDSFTNNHTKLMDGEMLTEVPCCWFTNLDIPKRHEPMKLGQCYYGYEDRYPKYDNYDAINVDKVAEIPGDYNGIMGVPITFMDKYCPEQFELIWTTDRGGDGHLDHLKRPHQAMIRVMKAINGSGFYFKDLDGDQEERNCGIWVRESHPHASYDRGVDLFITGEDNDHMLSVIMPVPYAQRFCNMISTGEYLTRDFQDFDEYSSVNDLMSISWVILAPKRDFCHQRFAFGKSDDGRYTITIRRHPGRYTAGSNLPVCRYLVFLSEEDLHDLAHEIQQVISFLKIKEKGGLKHDS